MLPGQAGIAPNSAGSSADAAASVAEQRFAHNGCGSRTNVPIGGNGSRRRQYSSLKGARRCHDEELSRAARSVRPHARNDSGHRRKVIGLGPESAPANKPPDDPIMQIPN